MFRGVTVVVEKPVSGGVDAFNAPTVVWESERVENVLVAPAGTENVENHVRTMGDKAGLQFHFPKTFTGSLRNCRIRYGDRVWEVEGDPQPYLNHLTPGVWNRRVDAYIMEG